MPRVNTVQKCRKDQGHCGSCHEPIKKGDGYRWIKFRYGGKRKRCTKPACRFRASDLTSSDKLSRTYAAQEQAQDAIDDWSGEDVEDLRNALRECSDEVREVASEYQESADNIRDSFSESSTADECEEKSQELEGWADEIEGVDFEDYDEDSEQSKDDWVEEQRSNAIDAVEACPL